MMASSDSKVHINIAGLDQLIKNLQEAQRYHVKIGVLKDGKIERPDGKSNADIGSYHEQLIEQEFGSMSKKLPRRSFLKFPLAEYNNGKSLILYLKKDSQAIMENLTLDKGTRRLYFKLGTRAKQIIHDAFESGGFGEWTPLKQSTINKKGHDKILIDKGELENSITFRTDREVI